MTDKELVVLLMHPRDIDPLAKLAATRIEALTAALAAAQQRIEQFKQYPPLRLADETRLRCLSCNIVREPTMFQRFQHAPTCPWAERGAEGGTQ